MDASQAGVLIALGWFALMMFVCCVVICISNHIQANKWQSGHPRLKLGTVILKRDRDQRKRN